MSKVIIFSREFPAYHPKAGQPTFFVEKFYNSFNQQYMGETFLADYEEDVKMKLNKHLPFDAVSDFIESLSTQRPFFPAKHHTIRKGKRWKVGDKFSPRVWGKDVNPKSKKTGAYNSKQIIIAPDIEVKKVWDFEISDNLLHIDGKITALTCHANIAKNDGLYTIELLEWFKYPKPFKGQIICWNDKIQY